MPIIKQAVILAGGRGARLGSLTKNRPKPMVLVNGKPFLEYLIELLKSNGIKEIILLLGYLPDKIVEYFGDGSGFGLRIKYSMGEVSDETGTRIRNARSLLADNFLLMYCDNYWPLRLDKLADLYEKMGLLALATVYNNKDGSGEYGFENNMHIDNQNHVLVYDRTRKDPHLNTIEIGSFILNKGVIDKMPDNNFSFETEILPMLVKNNELVAFRTDHPYYSITNPEFLKRTEKFLMSKKVVFLDRDGVINKKMPEHDYVKSWEEFEFLPGSIEAIRTLNENRYEIYVITNQPGIARNMMSREDLDFIHRNMLKELQKGGANVGGIYCCLHGWDDGCECRKPSPGLLFQAAREHHIDLTEATFIGDDERDAQAASNAGCKFEYVTTEKPLVDIVNQLV